MKNTKTRMDLCGFTADGELSGQISRASKKMRTHDKLCGRPWITPQRTESEGLKVPGPLWITPPRTENKELRAP